MVWRHSFSILSFTNPIQVFHQHRFIIQIVISNVITYTAVLKSYFFTAHISQQHLRGLPIKRLTTHRTWGTRYISQGPPQRSTGSEPRIHTPFSCVGRRVCPKGFYGSWRKYVTISPWLRCYIYHNQLCSSWPAASTKGSIRPMTWPTSTPSAPHRMMARRTNPSRAREATAAAPSFLSKTVRDIGHSILHLVFDSEVHQLEWLPLPYSSLRSAIYSASTACTYCRGNFTQIRANSTLPNKRPSPQTRHVLRVKRHMP